MRSLIILGCILCGCCFGQGYISPGKIDLQAVRKLSWEAAYRTLETEGAREHLMQKAKAGAPEALVAQALLFMSDGESYKKEIVEGFRRLQQSLKKLRSQNITEPDLLSTQFADMKMMEGALCAAALYHRENKEAVEFVISGSGTFNQTKYDPVTAIKYRLADLVSGFAWNWLQEEVALKYLSSNEPELRKGALVILLGEPIPEDPGATHFYDPSKSAEANKKAINSITKLIREDRDYYEKKRLERLERVKKKLEAERVGAESKKGFRSVFDAYKVAKGEEKKRLALQLDRLDRVDHTKEFGYTYPGKPLDRDLARRRMGIALYVEKMEFERKRVEYLPVSDREKPENRAIAISSPHKSLRAKLGMKNEAETVAEGLKFLEYVNAVLDGQLKELIVEELVWDFCEISYKYNKMKEAQTVDEFLSWEIWRVEDIKHSVWKNPDIAKRWAGYMSRNYKLNDYIDKHIVVDIHRYGTRRLLATLDQRIKDSASRNKEKDILQNRLFVNTPEEFVEAAKTGRQYMQEAAEFLAGKKNGAVLFMSDRNSLKINFLRGACGRYVLWKAMINATTFENYIFLNKVFSDSNGFWPLDEKYSEQYPMLLEEYKSALSKLQERMESD